jgi:phospholipid/cholesterol/gamma-HCH transport system substrate-binding protein
MNDQAIRFRIGIFVLAALILLAVLTILFGGFPSYFKQSVTYTIIFSNAQGIGRGTPVRRSGVRIGDVRSVQLLEETAKVETVIRVDHTHPLRKGDRPTIVQGLIGGDTSLVIIPPENPKAEDLEVLPPDSVLQGVSPPDPGTLVQKTSDLVQPAKEALVEIRKTFNRIDQLNPLIEETLKDFREVGKVVKQTSPEVEKTTSEFRALAKSMRETIPDLRRTNDEILVTSRNWGKVGERVDVLLKTNEDKIVKTVERAEESLKRLNNVLSDENQKYFNDALRNIRNASQQLDGIGKESTDLLRESRATVRQMAESLKKADEAIQDLQKGVKPIGDRGPKILKNLEDSTEELNRTLRDVREIIQVVGRSEGTIQRLVSDPSLFNNLNDSAEMLKRILPRVDCILRDAEIFSDRLARHPELLGIPGIFRPSNGLKESPSVIPYRVHHP